MDDLTFQFDDAFDLASRYAAAPKVVGEEMSRATDRTTIHGERLTKEGTPVVTGHGRRSVAHTPATFAGGVARGSWGTSVPYMKIVEKGRGPVVAGPGKVLRFVIDGRVLYRKRVRGARGKFMFRNAAARVRPLMRREFAAARKRIIARMGG